LNRIALIFILLISGIQVSAKHLHTEKYYQEIDCKKLNGITEYRIKGVRVDCLTDEYAIEHDFANNKIYEGISQALYYSQLTGKKPALHLIKTGKNDEVFVQRAKDIIEFWGLPIQLEVIEK
jgi:hypothetical protein